MTSTFHGLETAKRALLTQQVALQTVGHNISNAATVGYSRQRVNMVATSPLEMPAFRNSTMPGQIGTGVEYDSITRIRDSFLDLQFRRENQTLAMWEVMEQTFTSIEGLLNEPSDSGLRAVMDKFWNSLEVLNRDPSLLSARIDLIGAAVNLTDTLNSIDKGLTDITSDLESNITATTVQINSLTQKIADLNALIKRVEGPNQNANDLRDQRDLLVDQLSELVDVNVSTMADGSYTIVVAGVTVVEGNDSVQIDEGIADQASSGKLAGYVRSFAEVENVRTQLNAMVSTLVTGEMKVTLGNGYMTSQPMVAENNVTLSDGTVIPGGQTIPAGSTIVSPAEFKVQGFNGLHRLGYTIPDAETDIPFFTTENGDAEFTIGNIRVNPVVKNDTNKIAASGKYEIQDGKRVTVRGNGDISFALTNVRDYVFTFPSNMTTLASGTIDDFFRAFVGNLGTLSNNATQNVRNSQDLTYSAELMRQQVSGVSLDEELADMIRFQHAYNAAARNMTTVDEMLDRIINQMGIVGR
jgi:flagellar hook-associated protein 1 FlgK